MLSYIQRLLLVNPDIVNLHGRACECRIYVASQRTTHRHIENQELGFVIRPIVRISGLRPIDIEALAIEVKGDLFFGPDHAVDVIGVGFIRDIRASLVDGIAETGRVVQRALYRARIIANVFHDIDLSTGGPADIRKLDPSIQIAGQVPPPFGSFALTSILP